MIRVFHHKVDRDGCGWRYSILGFIQSRKRVIELGGNRVRVCTPHGEDMVHISASPVIIAESVSFVEFEAVPGGKGFLGGLMCPKGRERDLLLLENFHPMPDFEEIVGREA